MPNWTARHVRQLLRVPTAADDKYSRGVLGVLTGSPSYPGAAVLGVEAAARTGIGMIRYRGAASAAELARRPGVLVAPGRVHAWLIGSGLPELSVTDPVLAEAAASATPLVLDAGALRRDILTQLTAAGPRILTPHAGEAAVLLERSRSEVERDPALAAQELAARWSAVVVLKGSVTRVASPDAELIELGPATPWLATAGTGDVLAGILGAVVAGNPSADLAALAASAVWIHSAAAELASAGAPIMALDIARRLPELIRTILS